MPREGHHCNQFCPFASTGTTDISKRRQTLSIERSLATVQNCALTISSRRQQYLPRSIVCEIGQVHPSQHVSGPFVSEVVRRMTHPAMAFQRILNFLRPEISIWQLHRFPLVSQPIVAVPNALLLVQPNEHFLVILAVAIK